MDDLVTWLTVQLAEDERVARQASPAPRWDPARVLAEVEAKRAILSLHTSRTSTWWPDDEACEVQVCVTCSGETYDQDHDVEAPCPTVRALALPYRDRSGYRPEWAPEVTT